MPRSRGPGRGIETRYLFQSLVIPKAVVRATETLAPRGRRVPGIPFAPIDRLLRAWFCTEDLLTGWMPFGSSVLAVAVRGRPGTSRRRLTSDSTSENIFGIYPVSGF